ncbi:hypothetical protein OG625_06640 [Streptomyces sp. NBC_01351]|uniref:hypothetical protein n=1 Tax=Streptomyces sp. NBC_01351 TaxID=2903833 RepID=UPI002E37F281|nr:hypothetical protein [Streptomyces sp. NBC_01351]
MKRRTVAVGVAVVALTAVGLGIAAGWVPEPKDNRSVAPQWLEGVGGKEAAAYLRVQIPADAQDVKGAGADGWDADSYLLTFTVPHAEAEAIAADLRLDQPLKSYTPLPPKEHPSAVPFAHLGLPSPDTVPNARTGSVCPPCVGDKRRSMLQTIGITLQDLGGGITRVYLGGQ